MRAFRVVVWVLVIAAAVAALMYRASVYSERTPRQMGRIVLVTGGSAPYWQVIAAGARSAAEENEIDLTVEMPKADESVEEQTEILAQLDLNGVDGVAISPLDAEGQTALINKMIQRVFVVTVDSDAPLSSRDTYIGTNNFMAGRQAARLVHEAIPAGGQVAVVLANVAKDNLIQRKAGFEESINASLDGKAATSKYEVVDYLVDGGSEEKSRELLSQTIKDHPEVKCLVGMNAQHGPILLEVLKETGKQGEIKLVTFDYEDETLNGIERGEIHATVIQDPFRYGYEAVRRLAALHQGEAFERPLAGFKSSLSIGTQAVTKENLGDFRKEMASRQQNASQKPAKSPSGGGGQKLTTPRRA